jgi:uncharacterized OsmC-like protein
MRTEQANIVNGLDVDALKQLVHEAHDPARAMTSWRVSTAWKGGARTDARISGYDIGGRTVAKNFVIRVDEPFELGGANEHPNPQETLLAALNACMSVGYAAVAAIMGVQLTRLEIHTEGDIDLRGFLGVDPNVPAGYPALRCKVIIQGQGTPEQFRKIHETVMATSPNFYNLTRPVPLNAELVIRD